MRILDAVMHIHQAPLTADGWKRALPSIAAVVRCDLAVMVVKDARNGRDDCVVGFRTAPDHLAAFAAAVQRKNVPDWILSVPLGGVVPSSSAVSDRDFSRSAFYNEVVRPRGTFYGLVVKPMVGPHHHVLLTAGRRLGRQDFDRSDVEAMQTLMPHIVAAMEVGRRLAGVDLRATAASEAIDSLDTGMILVSGDREILFANRMAEGQLSHSGALFVRDGRLFIRPPSLDASLRRAVSECAASSSGLLCTKQAIEVPRSDNRLPLRLVVRAFQPDAVEASFPEHPHPRPLAIILIADPEKDRAAWKMRLRKEFGLTAAEAELALEISRGDGRDAAAARLGISVATVRTHLLHIFDKTGVHRQAELVRLLLDRSHVGLTDALEDPPKTDTRINAGRYLNLQPGGGGLYDP